MPKFSYQAIKDDGSTISGMVEADSVETANSILLARGYLPSKVTAEEGAPSRISFIGLQERFIPIKTPELILFTKQFKTMLRAGVPIIKLLTVLEDQTQNVRLKRIVSSIAQDIKEGSSLYDAFRKHPKPFSNLYCRMLQAGETSGALPDVLERLIYILEHEHKVKSDIKSALQYPIIVIIFLGIAFFVLLTFVIPKFVQIFLKAGIDLPLPTRICLVMYQILTNYWYLILGIAVAGITALSYYLRTKQGKYVRDTFLMKLPLIGPLFIKAAMSRFASIFAILQSSGVAILDAMKILSGTIGNAAISREFDQINERLEEGRGIAEPLKSARYFTPIVINMVAIGEESGNLDEMLTDVSEHYDSELEYAMKRLSDAIGPILIVGLAAVVGFFALAIYLPMWDLTKMVR
ncbi:MAG: type II secretion system F family protein [Deltaproteobacteria bacterium]|mgnify:CR=1 FL=1|nr:MAG: type II secretion system F family protein [Deltaproteobacteria bacterium]RLB96777.1 MAG: type II secretion system F family protein [Deltaproteobacteria bacterium]RLC11605.1 MAG: type II secretion system F family protein [Deltaproteobacteria bacterium]